MASDLPDDNTDDRIRALFSAMTGHAEDLAELAMQGQAKGLDQNRIRELIEEVDRELLSVSQCRAGIVALAKLLPGKHD